MNNLFILLNILGIGLYLSLIPVHILLFEKDKEEGNTGFFKRGRFSTGVLLIYLAFLSKVFGWDGFFGFARYDIFIQLIWLIWNSRSELLSVKIKGGRNSTLKLSIYNIIGISTLIYQAILYFKN